MVKTATQSEHRGRALLQCAVDAIGEGRCEDLTVLLQTHAPELRDARLRLEEHMLKTQRTVTESPQLAESEKSKSSPAKRAALFLWADRWPRVALLLVQLLTLLVYLPALGYGPGPAGFIMDDTVGIERNPNVISKEFSWESLLTRDYWGLPMHGSGWTNKSFRPLTTLTYRWNYLLHGLSSSGFHIANVLLHCVVSFIVGRVGTVTLGLPGSWAAISSLFFGVHPVHTENVLYLVGRADILAALLGLWALNAYSEIFAAAPALGQAPSRLLASSTQKNDRLPMPFVQVIGLLLPSTLIIASGLSKEIGFTLFALPAGMEVLDYIALRSEAAKDLAEIPNRIHRRLRTRGYALLCITVVTFFARYRHTGGTKLNMSPQDNPISFEVSAKVRALSYAYLHGVYGKLLVFPKFLCYDYSMDAIPAVRTVSDVRLLLPICVYVLLSGSITLALRAQRAHRRAALIALALMVVTYFPASNILFPVGTVVGERLMYVPSAGFCLALVVGLHGLCGSHCSLPQGGEADRRRSGGAQKVKHKSQVRRSRDGDPARTTRVPTRATMLLCTSILVLLAGRTRLRVRTWESADVLFKTDGETQPTSSKTQFNLGITYMQEQEWDKAVAALVRCAHADPLSSLPFYRIGQIEILRGRFDSAEKWLAAALDKFGASLMVRDEEVFHDLAVAMFQNGKPEAAEKRLQIALQLNQDFPKGWNNLACCMVSRDVQSATRASRRAVQLEPGNPQYWANLALLSRHAGDRQTAEVAQRHAVQLDPRMMENRDCTWEFAPAG